MNGAASSASSPECGNSGGGGAGKIVVDCMLTSNGLASPSITRP